MNTGYLPAAKRFLRTPRVIVGELVLLTVAGILGATWPDGHVFQSWWFIAITSLTAVSLAIIITGQFRRLLLAGATAKRLGSAILHVGLLAVIVAGMVHALFATEALVDLIEGETLPATAAAWNKHFPGRLAAPFHLDRPVTLEAVHGRSYPDGSLRELNARLSVGEVAVNHSLNVPGGRLFLTTDFAPAALVDWSARQRDAALLDRRTRTAILPGPNHLTAYLRAPATRSQQLELRIMKDNGLLYGGQVAVGETIRLPGGDTFTLHGLPLWARLRGSRDPSLGLAYAGFALIFAGTVMLFVLKPVTVRVPVCHSERSEESLSSSVPLRTTETLRYAQGDKVRTVVGALVIVSVFSSCHRSAREEARQLVTHYNEAVAEAYRRGDVRLIDSVVGPNEGKKLTGLIGVRLDMGLTLDSQLLALEVTGVERARDELRVTTKEQWRYRDRKIGTGEQAGEESRDSYEMRYLFKRINQAWLVDEIQFASPPQVGRKAMTWATTHGAEMKP